LLTPPHLALERSEGKGKFATRLVVYENPRSRALGSTELALSIDPTWAPCRSFVAVASNASWDELRTGSELETWNVIAVDMHKGAAFPLTHGNAFATSFRPIWGPPLAIT
jgi:hypothetical protein